MTARRQLLLFGGFIGIVILLLVVVGIVAAGRPNTLSSGAAAGRTKGERYVSDEFKPAFSFEAVSEGWTLDGLEATFVIRLHNGGSFLEFLNIKDLMVIEQSEADRILAPEDMIAWYQKHP